MEVDVDPDNETAVTAGAMEAIILALLAILDPGDEVLISDPGYTNYAGQVVMAGGVPIRVPVYERNAFSITSDDVVAAVTPNTRVVLLNTPANPTGAVLNPSLLSVLSRVCEKYGLVVIADEVYEALLSAGVQHTTIARLPDMKERTVTVMSFSKTHAMTGWRVGYAVGPASTIAQMQKLQENLVSCVNSAAKMGALAALTGPQECVTNMVKAYDARRRLLVNGLNSIDGITGRRPEGSFYVFPSVKALGHSANGTANWIVDHGGVVTVPGTAFGPSGEGYLRLSCAVSVDTLERALEGIKKAIGKI